MGCLTSLRLGGHHTNTVGVVRNLTIILARVGEIISLGIGLYAKCFAIS